MNVYQIKFIEFSKLIKLWVHLLDLRIEHLADLVSFRLERGSQQVVLNTEHRARQVDLRRDLEMFQSLLIANFLQVFQD